VFHIAEFYITYKLGRIGIWDGPQQQAQLSGEDRFL
jgi:hypothetical protein